MYIKRKKKHKCFTKNKIKNKKKLIHRAEGKKNSFCQKDTMNIFVFLFLKALKAWNVLLTYLFPIIFVKKSEGLKYLIQIPFSSKTLNR